MNAYTYYNPLNRPGLWDGKDQLELISLWSMSWKKHGWNPVVLSEADAKKNPRFTEYKRRFWELPTEYGHEYEGQCFMRYAAVATRKDNLCAMLDYDVINYGFTPDDALESAKKYPDPHLIFFSPTGFRHCGMTTGPWQLFEGYAAICNDWKIGPEDWNKSATFDGYHCSDNSMLVHMIDGKKPRPAWLVMDHSGPNWVWSRSGWEAAKTVHYGFEMKIAGNWPKWQHIQRLRPV